MDVRRLFIEQGFFPRYNDFPEYSFYTNLPKLKGRCPIELESVDIRDTDTDSHVPDKKKSLQLTGPQTEGFWPKLLNKEMNSLFLKNTRLTDTTPVDPADIDGSNLFSNDSPTTPTSNNYAKNLDEAAARTKPQLKKVVRGDEAELDAQVHDQASFGRLVDQVAKDYGLDPNQFRAQLEAESAAFSNGYKQGMRHEGDLDRGSNRSFGLGQISGNFLDGGPWSDALSGSAELGGQTISKEQYMNSVTTQLRLAAASTALRTHRTGGLDSALREYVSGNENYTPQNQIYIDNINRHMQNQEWMTIGR